jgi:lysophospholipase L1-like esterase
VLLLVGAAAVLRATRTRVVVLGDSHVTGHQSKPRGQSFVEILRQRLGWRYQVVAAGCPGSTSHDWTRDGAEIGCSMSNAYPELGRPCLPAEIVVILLGSNDAVGFLEERPLSPEVYAQAMHRLVRRVHRDGGARVLLLGPPPSPLAWPPAARRLQHYSEALAALAEREPDVSMGPDLQQFIDLDRHFGERTAHMNAEGHRLVGERLAPAVRALHESAAEGAPSDAS